MTKALAYFALLVSSLFMWQVRVNAVAMTIEVINEGPIPDGYETYILFLIPDEKWVSGEKDAELDKLYDDFLEFGEVIGRYNVAIWFRKKDARVDISHNKKYCDKLGLTHRGPFVVISGKNPDKGLGPGDHYTLDLNGISSDRITEILNYLGNSIRSGTFKWADTLNMSPNRLFRFRYPVRAAIKGLIKDPLEYLKQIFTRMNNLPFEEKKLNVQIFVILSTTLLASTFLAFKDKRIKLREQTIAESATILFLGVVCYYIIYNVIFFEYIGDTLVILILTAIYGLIPQRIVKHIPVMKKNVTYTPS